MTNVRESYELYVFRPLQPINSVTEFNIAHQRDYEITRERAVYAELNETNAFELRFIWILPKMGTVLTAHVLQCCGASHIASDFQCVFCFYLITLGHIVVSRRPFSSAPDLFIHVFHSPEIHSCAESLQKKKQWPKIWNIHFMDIRLATELDNLCTCFMSTKMSRTIGRATTSYCAESDEEKISAARAMRSEKHRLYGIEWELMCSLVTIK